MTKNNRIKAKRLFSQLEKYEILQKIANHGKLGGEAILYRSSMQNQLKIYDPELANVIFNWVQGKLSTIEKELEAL